MRARCHGEGPHEILRELFLRLPCTQRWDEANGNRNDLDVELAEVELIPGEVAELLRARACESHWEKREQPISLAAERRKSHHLVCSGSGREVRGVSPGCGVFCSSVVEAVLVMA